MFDSPVLFLSHVPVNSSYCDGWGKEAYEV